MRIARVKQGCGSAQAGDDYGPLTDKQKRNKNKYIRVSGEFVNQAVTGV